MTTKRTIPELSVDAQVLISRLKKLSKGEYVSYDELNLLVSGDVQVGDRDALQRARHRLLRDEKMVIETVHGKGLKRIEDADSVGIGSAASRRVRRLSRKAAEKMLCADYTTLTNDEKVQYNGHLSILGALTMITQSSKIKQVMDSVEKAQDKLPLNKTLDAFRA